jgi:hypothetical protein
MQPTYLPWLGYFDLIDQSDVFIFLDTVQFEKQSWQQRNRIKTAIETQWLTVPVYRSLKQKIMDVRIDNTKDWRRNHWMSLVNNYHGSSFWSSYSSRLESTYHQHWDRLAELNIFLIKTLCETLDLRPRFVRTSELPILQGKKAELLVDLCKIFGADTYLSPAGSQVYLESDAPFRSDGISLVFHQYEHPTYPQLYGEFIPYLSVVDLLLNTGPQALGVIRSGRRPSKPADSGSDFALGD